MKKFHLGRLGGDRLQEKIDRESSSEVGKMLGCLKCKYESCIFICRCLITLPTQATSDFLTHLSTCHFWTGTLQICPFLTGQANLEIPSFWQMIYRPNAGQLTGGFWGTLCVPFTSSFGLPYSLSFLYWQSSGLWNALLGRGQCVGWCNMVRCAVAHTMQQLEGRSSTRGCRSSRGSSDFSVISLQNLTKITGFNLDKCPNPSVKGHQNRTSLWLFFSSTHDYSYTHDYCYATLGSVAACMAFSAATFDRHFSNPRQDPASNAHDQWLNQCWTLLRGQRLNLLE